MTESEIIKGFWHFKPGTNFPPNGICEVKDYENTERLNLYIREKNQVKNWCENLHKLDLVNFLWVSSNVTQELFDSITKMKNLIGLNIERNTVTNIDEINKLHKLKYLRLANFAKIKNINSLGELPKLEVLSLENLKCVSNFEILGNLKHLEGLSIDGGIYRPQKIDNIEFISNLKKLLYLHLINTVMITKNFDFIVNLKNLETFCSSRNYPNSEFEKLKNLPNLKYSNIPIINKNGR